MKQKTVMLGSNKVGSKEDVYFIAEIGNNHNGDLYIAKKTIEEAAKAGAHAVKFQKRFINETFATELRDKPLDRGVIKGDTYGEYREGLELSKEEFVELQKVAKENNVDFFATPFDIKSADFLEELDIPFFKIASFDVTNLPLLEHVAKFNKPIILSTGMATEEEVSEAVSLVQKYHGNLILLHCVSVYPSPDEYVHLGAMKHLMGMFPEIPVGYSGHEGDILASTVAIAQGASIVERHFTLSRFLPGPDHSTVSIEPDVFAEMTENAQRIKSMNGNDKKLLLDEEQRARDKHSKSIVTKEEIKAGTIIDQSMVTFKSPGYGLKPKEIDSILGKKANKNIPADTVLKLEDIK